MVTGRGYTNKAVVGVVMDNPEQSTSSSSIQDYLAACTEVVRRKFGREVEIVVYVNKVIEESVEAAITDLHTTFLPTVTVFTSSPSVLIRTVEAGLSLTCPATGCSLCNTGFHRDLSQLQHEETAGHRRNALYDTFQTRRSTLLASPHPLGLRVTVVSLQKKDDTVRYLDSGLVEILCKPQEVKEFKIRLKYSYKDKAKTEQEKELAEEGGVIVGDIGLLRGEEVVQLWDEFRLCECEGTKIRLRPHKKYVINGRFTGSGIGQLKVPIMVTFYHETRSEVIGDRYRPSNMAVELLFRVEDEEVRSLVPRVPYQQAEVSDKWKCQELIRGKPLPRPEPGRDKGDSLEVKLPLGVYPPSDQRRKVIEGRLERCGQEELEELEQCRDLVKNKLAMENYGDRWEFLLHCERVQEERDIRQFDMSGVELRIDKTTSLLALEVPGLLEGRPSLIKGDKVFLTCDKIQEYEGFVHSVGKTRVLLGLSDQILTHDMKETAWFVRFHASSFSWDNMHRAVRLCVKNNLRPFLFPRATDLPLGEEAEAPLRYCDQEVGNNPEQRAAVSAIVAGRSGRVPYLVFGPPGTGKTVTLVEAIKQVWRLDSETHILACAPSNTAADLLTVRLARDLPADQILRLNALSRPDELIPDSVRPQSNTGPAGHFIPPMAELAKFKIIVSTLVTAGKLASAVFPQVKYRVCFVSFCH